MDKYAPCMTMTSKSRPVRAADFFVTCNHACIDFIVAVFLGFLSLGALFFRSG